MIKTFKFIILSYGLFLGWLLSFPYNGPIMKKLIVSYGLHPDSFSLTYMVAPVLFLIFYSFYQSKEAHAKAMMTWSLSVCLLGTLIIFFVPPNFWYPILCIIGICSVIHIIGWSYYYTMTVPVTQKMPVMALVIITGNSIHYVINFCLNYISNDFLLMIMITLLAGSYYTSTQVTVKKKITIELQNRPFPVKLIFILCLFLFAVNLNGGLTSYIIYPSMDTLFVAYLPYYGTLPYIITLLIMYVFGRKTSSIFPVFLGTSFLGLAYLSFGLIGDNWYNYFITETFLQAGWALLDLILWTLFGMIASVYGRPLKICGYAFLANLLAVFTGGLLGIGIRTQIDHFYLISAAFAIAIIFVSLIIVPWLNDTIEKDLKFNLSKKTPSLIDVKTSSNFLENELLTEREKEVIGLILQGYTNNQIADMLFISKNTVKTHTRNIYSKLNVSNKRELLQTYYGTAPTTL